MELSTLQIAWRNLGRNRKRTLLAIAAIALGQFTLVFVNCMMAGMYSDMLKTITGPLLGHVQLSQKDWREERAMDLFVDKLDEVRAGISAIPGVETVSPRIYAPVLSAPGAKSDEPADAEPGMIIGLDIATETSRDGMLELLTKEQQPSDKDIVLGAGLARKLRLKAGDQIAVIGQDADEFPVSDLFTVKAVIRSNTEVINTMGIVMPIKAAQEMLALSNQAHQIIIQGEHHEDAAALAARVRTLPAIAGAETEVLTWREAAPVLVNMIDMKDGMDMVFVLILFVAAAAGIANTMMMSTFERTHEFGMLLAVGSRPARIVRMVLVESVVLGLIGVAIGSVIGSALVFITAETGIDFSALTSGEISEFNYKGLSISYVIYPMFEWRHVVFGVVAVTLTSMLASLWPAMSVARLEPAKAMRS